MKLKLLSFISAMTLIAAAAQGQIVISGIIDGGLSGGLPKAVQFTVTQDIADLSIYGFGSANNGGGSDGEEFTFSGSATAGQKIWVATETSQFTSFFGFGPNFKDSAAGINGNDAIELFKNGSVIDTFGQINVDGTGTAWEYLDGYAFRKSGTVAETNGAFNISHWNFSGPNALDGVTTAAAANIPHNSYSAVPEPSTYAAIIGALALGGIAYRRRRQAVASASEE